MYVCMYVVGKTLLQGIAQKGLFFQIATFYIFLSANIQY